MKFEQPIWFLAAALLLVVGCEPYQEDGPGLPQPPTAEVTWYFLPDTVDGVPGIDSNTVVFEAEPSEDVFMELWDFGNGKVSGNSVDTMVYYVEDTYACPTKHTLLEGPTTNRTASPLSAHWNCLVKAPLHS